VLNKFRQTEIAVEKRRRLAAATFRAVSNSFSNDTQVPSSMNVDATVSTKRLT
jgi:hypothetical protein